ncbi:MAG: hypothetical protein ACRECY_16280, partial [Phyllobacterium sp.]
GLPRTTEDPWSKAHRLAEELSEILDQCNGGRWKAIIAPMSTNKDRPAVMFVSLTAEEGAAKRRHERIDALLQMMNAHAEALAAYSRLTDQEWEEVELRGPVDAEIERTRKALLDHRCQNATEFQIKSSFMAECRSFHDWDDIERIALINALSLGTQS